MAGYSGTPLPQKLGIRPDHVVALVNTPTGFLEYLGPLPDGATVVGDTKAKLDVALLFVTGAADLRLSPHEVAEIDAFFAKDAA